MRSAAGVTALLASLALAAPATAAQHTADGNLADWTGEPTYLAGRTQVSKGELIYTDYLYDDYGPDLNHAPDRPAFRSNLAPTNGDYRYPADPGRYGYNAADLRELRIAADADRLHVLIGLQTMLAPDAAIASIALDADGNALTGAPAWSDGLGLKGVGAERTITVWGTGGHVTDALGRATDVKVAANLEENAIEVDVPWGVLGDVGETAKAYAVTGLNDGGRYAAQPQGGPGAWNVAFRGDDDWPRLAGHWGEHEQSQALASGDVSAFAQPLRLADLRAGRDVPFKLEPGFYDRIFRSRETYGEGIDLKQDAGAAGNARPMFKGRWQPYGLYVPKGYDPGRPAPLLLNGHSLDVNHNEYRAVGPNSLVQLGDERGSLIITPLARGIDTWYLDAGLFDVMEAWKDVKEHYAVDDQRTSITGYSMGGYMTYRMGLLMPDRFARASVYVGPPAYSIWPYPAPVQSTPEWLVPGNTNRLVRNALNLPYEVVHGNADELVPVGGVQQQVDDLMAAGTDVTFYRHSADDHLSFILADRWDRTRRFLGDARITQRPERVRFRRYPSMDLKQYGLTFDRAYWASRIEVRDAPSADSWGEVDAATYALGGWKREVGEKTVEPGVAIGGLSPATVTEQHAVRGPRIARRNAFDATLENVKGVRFDLARMGVNKFKLVVATLRGDGETTIRLTGRFPRVRARLDGELVRAVRVPGGLRLTLPLTKATARLSIKPVAKRHR
ncbi:MAG: prolyl oligopeptidase family serine peptidase [Solirubrobacterales bacterium]|nr:prolyl oligopeptidase family serine peptidase [Solirubrobacterales bacterium]